VRWCWRTEFASRKMAVCLSVSSDVFYFRFQSQPLNCCRVADFCSLEFLCLCCFCCLLFGPRVEVTVPGFPTDLNSWAVINAKFSFFHRVVYDDVSHAAIVSQLLLDHTVSLKNNILVNSFRTMLSLSILLQCVV